MAASAFFDLVRFYSGTTGTGTTVAIGSAVTGFRTPAQASVPDGTTCSYSMLDGSNWEKGTFVYHTATPNLTITTTESSNSNSPISRTSSCIISVTALSADLPNLQGANTWAGGQTFGKSIIEKEFTVTDGAGAVIDASLGNIANWTAGADRTAGTTTNPTSGQKLIINFKASGGARTLSLPVATTGDFAFGSDITGLTQTASGKTDVIGCIYNSVITNRWAVVAYAKGY